MTLFRMFSLILTFSAPAIAFGNDSSPQSFAGHTEMNGYTLKDYRDFEKSWHKVTVRFRKDTDEIRLIYANDKAWAALSSGKTDYPDGSVFAKVAIATQPDPLFPSSAVPSTVRRFQLMVKNKKQHSETKGWGYALFDANGLTFPEDPKATVQACAACHEVAASRGYIFALPLDIDPFQLAAPSKPSAVASPLEYTSESIVNFPELIKKELPEGTKAVRRLKGPMSEHLFQGTLDEIRPALATEAMKSGLPAVLMDTSGTRFSLVYADPKFKCSAETGAMGFVGVHNIYFKNGEKFQTHFCQQQNP